MQLETRLAGITLEHPLMNAGGTCKTVEQVEQFVRSAVSAVVVGPVTPLPRDINKGDVYYQGLWYSLNSLGMPNPGERKFFGEYWPRMVPLFEASGKPAFLQLAGFSPGDYVRLARTAEAVGIRRIELNFGCPNVWDDGRQHGIVSFDPDAIVTIVRMVREVFSGWIGIKLSPYSDPNLLKRVAEALNGIADSLDYVALSNTFPNAMILDDSGRPVITPGDGLAGLSGKAMFPIALGQVYQFVALLENVDIVGVGGITGGNDIRDFRRAGAVAVQASTPYWNAKEDPGVYSDILDRYVSTLEADEASEAAETEER